MTILKSIIDERLIVKNYVFETQKRILKKNKSVGKLKISFREMNRKFIEKDLTKENIKMAIWCFIFFLSIYSNSSIWIHFPMRNVSLVMERNFTT